MGSAITIKGARDGLRIVLGAGKMDDLLVELGELVASREAFFRGGEVVLQFGEQELIPQDVTRALKVLSEYKVAVRAVLGQDTPLLSPVRRAAPAETVAPGPPPETPPAASRPGMEPSSGILVRRTLRSGQSIHHAGHVVIIGDVNPGAEVVAEGDIIVWGHLRGTVHAGAAGDEKRCICALDLSPTQLRIGNRIARPPEDKLRRKEFGPERACVRDEQIIAEKCL